MLLPYDARLTHDGTNPISERRSVAREETNLLRDRTSAV
jgi:hypothetical protein